jgi:hemerythrin-like domain-containing protein
MTTTQSSTIAVPQWLLPRQVAAPEGQVDVKMMYVMHHAFRRDLVMFAAASAATPAGDADTWTALAERWRVFSTILHHHHSGEDAGLWPRLMQEASPEEQETLDAMEAEHAQIDPILAACANGFERVTAATDPAAAAFLAEQLAAARDTLLAHMGHEETEAMALVQKHLTQEDWDRVVEDNFDKNMPTKLLLAAVPWIAHELPRDARDVLLAEAGTPMKLLWFATRRRFARLESRATRHVA